MALEAVQPSLTASVISRTLSASDCHLSRMADDCSGLPRHSWMKSLAEKYPVFAEKPLSEIAFPGSHDSGTCAVTAESHMAPNFPEWASDLAYDEFKDLPDAEIQAIYAPWTKAQNLDAFTQLQKGVRYLDLRVCYEPDKQQLWLCHGLLSMEVINAIKDVARFMRESGPDEILLLDFQQLIAFPSSAVHMVLLEMVKTYLGEWLCFPGENKWRTTLSALWGTNERIIVFYRDPAVAEAVPWLWNREDSLTSPWPDTTSNYVLLEKMSKQVEQFLKEDISLKMFSVVQSQRSPDSDLVVSEDPTDPKSLADLARMGTHLLVCEWLEMVHRATSCGKWSGKMVSCLHAEMVNKSQT